MINDILPIYDQCYTCDPQPRRPEERDSSASRKSLTATMTEKNTVYTAEYECPCCYDTWTIRLVLRQRTHYRIDGRRFLIVEVEEHSAEEIGE